MAFDYTTLTDGATEPCDHAPKDFAFQVDEMALDMAKTVRDLCRQELHRLERLELQTMAMRGTTEDLYFDDEDGRAKAEADYRRRQHVLQLYDDTLTVWMNEPCLEFVPTAADRAESRIEDEGRDAA
jgi:hypothetical protein